MFGIISWNLGDSNCKFVGHKEQERQEEGATPVDFESYCFHLLLLLIFVANIVGWVYLTQRRRDAEYTEEYFWSCDSAREGSL